MNYRDRIRALPCLNCGKSPSEAAHIRFSDARAAKDNPGIGAKPEDRWCIPLCSGCHRGVEGQHSRGERAWWDGKGIDPIFVALALWGCKAEYEASCKIIRQAQEAA